MNYPEKPWNNSFSNNSVQISSNLPNELNTTAFATPDIHSAYVRPAAPLQVPPPLYSHGSNPYFQTMMPYSNNYSMNYYNRYGNYSNNDYNSFIQEAYNTFNSPFQTVSSVINTFDMFLRSFHSAFDSFLRSLQAIISFFDMLMPKSKWAQISSVFATLKVVKVLYHRVLKMIGLRTYVIDNHNEKLWKSAMEISDPSKMTEADLKAKSSGHSVLFWALVLSSYFAFWKIYSVFSSLIGERGNVPCITICDIKSRNRDELSVSKGTILQILPPRMQPTTPGWLLATDGKRQGYVQIRNIQLLKAEHNDNRLTTQSNLV